MGLQRRKTRMYEPWGYRDQNYYESDVTGNNSDLSKFFAKTEYVKNDNKIYFYNEHGATKGVLDVSEFMKDDKIIEKAYYDHDSQSIIIKFTNGDTITVPVEDLLDINEFKDGLTVDSGTTPSGKEIGVVKVLKDPESERWLTVSINGVKVSGIQDEIDRLDARIDKEIEDRIADVDEEEVRAKAAEAALDAKINAEIARSTDKDEEHEDQLNVLDQRLGLVERQLPDEINQRKERAFADASYDENTKEIVFKNALGVKIDSIDATPFLNDGMVESVYIDHETEELVIVWNPQSGQQETRIPLTEIFNPNDYYTKDDIDGIVNGITSSITEAEDSINEETSRATSAETALQTAIDGEAQRAQGAEEALANDIDAEAQRAQGVEGALQAAIDNEETRAISAETALGNGITTLGQALNEEANRAIGAESDLLDAIDDEATERKATAVASAEYDESGKTIVFKNVNGAVVSSIDASDFIKDGMVDDVKIDGDNLVITFNTESGKEAISIPLASIFNPDNYYDKTAVDGFVGDLEAADNAISGAVDDLSAELENESQRAVSAETDLASAIELKADSETTYTKEEVDALISEKEAEIVQVKKDYNNLKEIVGELGGNVEWGVPADGTFNNMMKKSGTVKLGEDTTTSTYAGGITSKNETTLNLNGKNLKFSGQTTTNPGIMTRGKQKLTIMGKGTFDADGRIAVEANGADTVINLSGTTGMFGSEPTYVTDRSGGELIYCYLGTINISAGVFKNLGDDKTFLLNCYDANYRAGTAKIVVTGGKFYDFNPADNRAEGEHTSFVPEGYHVETSTVVEEEVEHTVYTVKKD